MPPWQIFGLLFGTGLVLLSILALFVAFMLIGPPASKSPGPVSGLSYAPLPVTSPCGTWTTTFHDGTDINALAAISDNDVWAAGTAFWHWDGETWEKRTGPGQPADEITSLSAVSSGDIWAVTPGSPDQSYRAYHLNADTWEQMPAPTVGPDRPTYLAFAASGTNDAWAVGASITTTLSTQAAGQDPISFDHSIPLLARWDGAQWKVVDAPKPVLDPNKWSWDFEAVDTSPSGDVWAIGRSMPWSVENGFSEGGDTSVTMHWDGKDSAVWIGNSNTRLGLVHAISSNDVWTVGSTGPLGSKRLLVQHWDGSSWNAVQTPSIASEHPDMKAIDSSASDNVWMVGSDDSGTLAMHWDGSKWSIVPAPNNPDSSVNGLGAVAVTPNGTVWATGLTDTGSLYNPLDPHTFHTTISRFDPASCPK